MDSTGVDPRELTIAIEGWNASDLADQQVFEACLRSLSSQTFPTEQARVLVIVDAEMGGQQANRIQQLLPTAEIVPLERTTYYRTKNRALEMADSPYLVLADSDMVYQPSWLAEMIKSLRPGVDFVVGDTKYAPGWLHHTLDLCDWVATRPASGFTDSFYANNLLLRRQLYTRIRFRDDMGSSGGGGSDVLRHQLIAQGIYPWYCAEARGVHDLPGFLAKRLRIGAFQIHYRRLARESRWSWLARLGWLSPFPVIGGTLLKAWVRTWRLRGTLPWGGWSYPYFVVTLALVKAIELVGALMYVVMPKGVNRRFGWFDVPQAAPAEVPA
jgi:glycosyltransferase involved in cell wall biosynthesis